MKGKFSFRRSYLEEFILIAVLLIISFVFLTNSPLHIWIGSDSEKDSSVFLTVAMMMNKGYMPYRDTFDHKGPLLYLINYLGRRISAYRGVWVIEFISMFSTFLFIYKIARLKCGKALSYIVLLLSISLLFDFFQGGNLTEEYAMPFLAGSMYIFLDYFLNSKISVFRLVFCGLCFGGVCLLRPNMISLWIVFCIAILFKCIRDKSYHDLMFYITYFWVGFLLIVVPIVLWLAINNCIIDFWNVYIRFNFAYSSMSVDKRWSSFFYFLDKPAMLISIVISVYLFFNSKERFLYGTYCCYLFCTLLLICMSGRTYDHYGMILVPAVAFPIASLFGVCIKSFSEHGSRTVSFLIALYFLYALILPDWISTVSALSRVYRLREEEHKSELVNEVCSIVDLNSTYDDKISVYGNWDIIYLLSDREHATKYSYQFPLGQVKSDIMDEYFDELQEQLPPIIIVQEFYDRKIKEFLDDNDYSLIWPENGDDREISSLIFKR